nr:immunoglobulin heavy chain junction region [Mus musculus]
ITVQTGTALT